MNCQITNDSMNEYYNIGIIYLILLTVVLTLWRLIDDNFQKMQYLENGREADRYMENVHEILFSTQAYLWYIYKGKLMLDHRFFEKNNLRERGISVDTILKCVSRQSRIELTHAIENADETGIYVDFNITLPMSHETHSLSVLVCREEEQKSHSRKDAANTSDGVMGILTIIDGARQKEKERKMAFDLEEESKLKASFLAAMGHEIRTPVNIITGFSQILAQAGNETSEEELKSYSQIIADNTEQLLRLLNDVLKSNPESEEMHMALKTWKVKDFVEELYATYNVVIPDHLEYNMVRGPEDVNVNVNRSSMMQVMSNLVNNAVKFTKEGGITMGWECTEENVVIFLEDTGIGIPKEKQELIFDRYYKESSSTAGAGIGLSLCRRLVENMNGKIIVKSEPGKGSRFELIFKKAYNG